MKSVFLSLATLVSMSLASASPDGLRLHQAKGVKTNLPFRCGSSWDDANEYCYNACPSGKDFECDKGQRCFRDLQSTCDGDSNKDDSYKYYHGKTNMPFRCGSSWDDANDYCGNSCPSGKDYECGKGERCFRDLVKTCDGKKSSAPSLKESHEYNSGKTNTPFRCGSSWDDANEYCYNSCPSGKDYECGKGHRCFRDLKTTCDGEGNGDYDDGKTNTPYRCGSSREDANKNCYNPCPSGKDNECGQSQRCFRDLKTTC
ncbi:hypothetical protein BC830DRAFT_1117080 [Chytriomyces sp. MP71]|nr:hypothetical protein BC830DRAFT_1117080 [Chytriomyces sp. MP71]